MKSNALLLLYVIFNLVPSFGAESGDALLAWQSSNPITPPNFESYFPDDPEASARLSELPKTTEEPDEAVLVRKVRQGLRRGDPKAGNEWIKWLGQKLIAARETSGQSKEAIELVYHASANPLYQENALYHGLSRVKNKTAAILRRFVEIAIASDDWGNVIGHVAWAGQDHRSEMVAELSAYLASNDPKVRSHAEVLQRIFAGEITAHEHGTNVQRERATAQFGSEMESFRLRLTEGDSAERRDLLRLILQNGLTLIMDDKWIEAYAAAAKDSDRRVRQEVARQLGSRWAWQLQNSDAVNPRALEVLIQLSRDPDREVRSDVRYHGLSRLPKNEAAQARLREMESEDLDRFLTQAREAIHTAIEQRDFSRVESILHEIRPGLKQEGQIGDRIGKFVAEIEDEVAKAQRPQTDLQRRIDNVPEGGTIDLGAASFEGPILIEKDLTLRGVGLDQTTISYRGDEPTILIRGAYKITIENLTVRWSPTGPDTKMDHPAAIAVREAQVMLKAVSLEPIERMKETPNGLMALHDSKVEFVEGRTRGFAYALIWLEGADGAVRDSDLREAGHSVITVHPGSKVEIVGNLLADCGYHAVRVTGGTVEMHDNIVKGCARAGAYLGNKDAHGRIYNNLFTANLGEIWGYYRSDVLIENNLFYRSNDPAIIFWNTCALVARANSFTANPAAIRQYLQEKNPNLSGIRLVDNHYWQNNEDIQPRYEVGGNAIQDDRFQLTNSSTPLIGDPKFRNPKAGDFAPLNGSALRRDNPPAAAGLLDPDAIYRVARKYNLRFE